MEIRLRPLLCGTVLCLLVPSVSGDELLQETGETQRAQAELQLRIEAADDEVRERFEELRRLEREARRLNDTNATLAPYLERQAAGLERRETALETLAETREALPDLQRRLVEHLGRWVDQDLPFLREERHARVAGLESDLSDHAVSPLERVERIFAAWRAELDYGREFDAWRGYLMDDDTRREVEFLRLGRVGFYYLTPDGREGGSWNADEERWVALDEAARREVRHGLRIARDQRAPELLHLPVARTLTAVESSDGGGRP